MVSRWLRIHCETAWVEPVGNLNPGSQGKLFVKKCLTGGTLPQNHPREVPGEVAGCWILSVVFDFIYYICCLQFFWFLLFLFFPSLYLVCDYFTPLSLVFLDWILRSLIWTFSSFLMCLVLWICHQHYFPVIPLGLIGYVFISIQFKIFLNFLCDSIFKNKLTFSISVSIWLDSTDLF